MPNDSASGPGRVIGLGGVFFKSEDPARIQAWYGTNLGLVPGPGGVEFQWRSHDNPEKQHSTIWSVFPSGSDYFGPGRAPFMINYIVDDMDAILAKLAGNGVRIDPKREDHDYGRFAWIFDPDGNKIELWEPRGA